MTRAIRCSSYMFRITYYYTLVLSTLPILAQANCECGYLVAGALFTHSIITDFSRFPDKQDIMDGSGQELRHWEVQEWSTSVTGQKHGHGEYKLPRQNVGENVWIKGGRLHMRQNGYSEEEAAEELPVEVSEIVTRRSDIFYGSFRSSFRIVEDQESEGGSVAGFFFYYSDEAETDIEILTRDSTTIVHYSQQPTYDAENDFFYEKASITAQLKKPWTEFQEHRWDWHPGISTFYQNGEPVVNLRNNVPDHKGTIMVNLWADGGNWSGPPSTHDVILEIQYFHLYFNISSEEGNAVYVQNCENSGGWNKEGAICDVDRGEGKEHVGNEFGSARRVSVSWWGWLLVVWFSSFVMGGSLS